MLVILFFIFVIWFLIKLINLQEEQNNLREKQNSLQEEQNEILRNISDMLDKQCTQMGNPIFFISHFLSNLHLASAQTTNLLFTDAPMFPETLQFALLAATDDCIYIRQCPLISLILSLSTFQFQVLSKFFIHLHSPYFVSHHRLILQKPYCEASNQYYFLSDLPKAIWNSGYSGQEIKNNFPGKRKK